MKIYIIGFKSNRGKPLDYYIEDIHSGFSTEGVITVTFKTNCKYPSVGISSFIGRDGLKGKEISINPTILDEDLKEIDLLDYAVHPDNFLIHMVVPCDGAYASFVKRIHDHYVIDFIPMDLLQNFDCISKAKVVFTEYDVCEERELNLPGQQ